jgi:hypothetical protein
VSRPTQLADRRLINEYHQSGGPARYVRANWTSIPNRYHFGMSKQIAIRRSDELVDFVDTIVENGDERSRAAVVTRALKRERRRMIAAQDAKILDESGPDPDAIRAAFDLD